MAQKQDACDAASTRDMTRSIAIHVLPASRYTHEFRPGKRLFEACAAAIHSVCDYLLGSHAYGAWEGDEVVGVLGVSRGGGGGLGCSMVC